MRMSCQVQYVTSAICGEGGDCYNREFGWAKYSQLL